MRSQRRVLVRELGEGRVAGAWAADHHDLGGHPMMNGADREAFALQVMREVRRWPGVQIRPHLNPTAAPIRTTASSSGCTDDRSGTCTMIARCISRSPAR